MKLEGRNHVYERYKDIGKKAPSFKVERNREALIC